MKILFVCRYNNGRSQIAEAIFQSFNTNHIADSAGYYVDKDGQTIAERASQPGSETGMVISVLGEIGLDVAHKKRTQFKESMLNDYDKIIVMLQPHETPDYFNHNPRVEFWRMDDPKGRNIEGLRLTRDEIANKVEQLLKEIKI